MNPLWYSLLDERQQKEVMLALIYVNDFNHGTPGHNHFVLIAKLVDIINELAKRVLLESDQ